MSSVAVETEVQVERVETEVQVERVDTHVKADTVDSTCDSVEVEVTRKVKVSIDLAMLISD